jgi:hypothetical protein
LVYYSLLEYLATLPLHYFSTSGGLVLKANVPSSSSNCGSNFSVDFRISKICPPLLNIRLVWLLLVELKDSNHYYLAKNRNIIVVDQAFL